MSFLIVAAVAEIAARTFHLFRHLCCMTCGIATGRCPLLNKCGNSGVGSLRAQGRCTVEGLGLGLVDSDTYVHCFYSMVIRNCEML